jgi:drug/metabolite transporter (DMT)-like permease
MAADQRSAGGVAAAVTVALIWGLSFVAASVVLTTLSPVVLATLRFTIASALFLPVILRELNKGSRPSMSDLRETAYLGFLSISLYFWLQYTGVKYAGAGVSALLVVGFIPILTGVASSFMLGETLSRWKVAGSASGFLGVGLITVPKLTDVHVNTGFLFGVICLLGNAVCWSLYSTMSRRLMQRTGKPLLVTAYVTLSGTLVLLPLSLASDWSAVRLLTQSQWLSVLYLAIVCSGGGYLLWNYALSRLESVRAAIWLYLEPVAAFVGEALLLGIMPDALTAGGGLLIMVGALLTSAAKK